MTDKSILERYVDLEKSCLSDLEKKQVIDMLYKYKDAFSLKVENGTCPNIEVEIDVTDKSPFLGNIMSRRKMKIYWIRDMKRLCYLGILKEGFSAYVSPGMLISRKDKRAVTDFRHLKCKDSKE